MMELRGRGRPPLSDEELAGRAERILEAAARLVLERGYDLVTVDDIAALAGVAKGTVYRHWANRDELFLDLVRREQSTLAAQLVRASPETVVSLMREAAMALLQRPLLIAILTGNSTVWGRLLEQLPASTVYGARLQSFELFLGNLRERQQIRTDQTLHEQLHLVTGVLAGFLMARPLIPSAYGIDDEQLARIMADTISRSLSASEKSPLRDDDVAPLLLGGNQARASNHAAPARPRQNEEPRT